MIVTSVALDLIKSNQAIMTSFLSLFMFIGSSVGFCSTDSIPNKVGLQDMPYLSPDQLEGFYDLLISEIERLDAEGIETRNNTKAVSWDTYKAFHQSQFREADNWNALASAYNTFGKGFVNLHSHFQFSLPSSRTMSLSDIQLGYTYPEISFYNLKTKDVVTHINGVDIESVYYQFENYNCAFNSKIGCVASFVSNFRLGSIKVKGEAPRTVTYENGQSDRVIYTEKPPTDRYARYLASVDTARYDDSWKPVAYGYKVALYKKDDIALIRIKDFMYPNGNGGGLDCGEAASDSTVCKDIQILRAGLDGMGDDIDYLIFDIMDNGGGNENSSFIAEFAMKPFYDMATAYRKNQTP